MKRIAKKMMIALATDAKRAAKKLSKRIADYSKAPLLKWEEYPDPANAEVLMYDTTLPNGDSLNVQSTKPGRWGWICTGLSGEVQQMRTGFNTAQDAMKSAELDGSVSIPKIAAAKLANFLDSFLSS